MVNCLVECSVCGQKFAEAWDDHACNVRERNIRADERAKCYKGLRVQADKYVETWGPIIGQDAAKADAWNIIVAAKRVCGESDNGSEQ